MNWLPIATRSRGVQLCSVVTRSVESRTVSIFQRVLSYGLEARSPTIVDELETYLKTLEKLLSKIDANEMHETFNVKEELKVIKDIRNHIKVNIMLS